jgi:hypothetical protein
MAWQGMASSPPVSETLRSGARPSLIAAPQPQMLPNAVNLYPLLDLAIQHLLDQVETSILLAVEGRERHPQRVVQDLVNVVEGVLFVHNGVEQNPKSPHILLFPAIRFALKHLGRRVI